MFIFISIKKLPNSQKKPLTLLFFCITYEASLFFTINCLLVK